MTTNKLTKTTPQYNKTAPIELNKKYRNQMKRFRILTLLLAITFTTPALLHAQIIKGEAFVGANGCQVDGDECYGFKKFGVNAGHCRNDAFC